MEVYMGWHYISVIVIEKRPGLTIFLVGRRQLCCREPNKLYLEA
jgi:hypothetical protein